MFKNILSIIFLLNLASCASNPQIDLSPNSVNGKAKLTSDIFYIYSIDGRIPQDKGGNKRTFLIAEGKHHIGVKLNVGKCSLMGCWSKTSGLIDVYFTVEEGKEYKVISQPAKNRYKFHAIVVDSTTGEIASHEKEDSFHDISFYDITTGTKYKGRAKNGNEGEVSLKRENSTCIGEYVHRSEGFTVSSKSSSWGGVFSKGVSSNFSVGDATLTSVKPNSRTGTSILVCPGEGLLNCEYIFSSKTGHGYGYCSMDEKLKYKFIF